MPMMPSENKRKKKRIEVIRTQLRKKKNKTTKKPQTTKPRKKQRYWIRNYIKQSIKIFVVK